MIILPIFAISSSFSNAQVGTSVAGVISTDTTWTQDDSPYTLTGNSLVANGVTLTIQAGTTVNLGNYYIEVNGTLQAVGNASNPVLFNGGYDGIRFDEWSNSWNQTTCSGNLIQNSVMNSTVIDIEGCSSPKITNNLFVNSSGEAFYYSNGAAILVEGYSVYGNVTSPASIISNNTFFGSNIAISIHDIGFPSPTIEYNNFLNNQYNIYLNEPTSEVNATYNYWSATTTQTINSTIYDFKDNFKVGNVSFVPFLNAPNTQAPTLIEASAGIGGSIAPSGITCLNYGSNQSFAMTPNDGYHITGIYVNGTMVGAYSSYVVRNISGISNITATFAVNDPETWSIDSGAYVNGVHNSNPSSTLSDNGTIQINQQRGHWLILYTQLIPVTESFSISLDVNAQNLQGFFVEAFSNPPMVGGTNGVCCDIGPSASDGGGAFTVSRNANGWVWNRVAQDSIQNYTWYTIVLAVSTHPYQVTGSIYDKNTGTLLGRYSASDMTMPTYAELSQGYIGFGASENGGNYTVSNISISSQVISTPTPTASPTPTPTVLPTASPTSTASPTTIATPTANPTSPDLTPSSTPTIPELSAIAVLPLLFSLLSVAAILRRRKSTNNT